MEQLLRVIRDLLDEVRSRPETAYRDGYEDALLYLVEVIEEDYLDV